MTRYRVLEHAGTREGLTLDSYIVRIYRRGLESSTEIAGLIERIGNGKRQAFASSEELWAFLTGRHSSRRKAPKARHGKGQG